MDKIGSIEIKVSGVKGNLDVTPDNYDIRELIAILESVEDLLYADKKERPVISYSMQQGSVRHIFKTSMQYIIGFNAVIGQVNQVKSIDFLDFKTAKAFERIQDIARKTNYSFHISTSIEQTNALDIDAATTFYRTEAIWADAEFYFYGKITNAGGKDKANIHVSTEEFGILRIETPISFLQAHDENILYKTFGVHARGKQHSETGEIDTSTLKFVELIDYSPQYNEAYLKTLRDRAKKNWLSSTDSDKWLKEIRGYDA